jgi:hypothetical protein
MLHEEFRQLFGRSGVPTVYQVAHLCKPASDYQYRIVAIRPWESSNKVPGEVLPRSIMNRQRAEDSEGGMFRGPRVFSDLLVLAESVDVSYHFGPEVGTRDKFHGF